MELIVIGGENKEELERKSVVKKIPKSQEKNERFHGRHVWTTRKFVVPRENNKIGYLIFLFFDLFSTPTANYSSIT